MRPTKLQKFYENKTIFITGGTGFLGHILVEKLLRSCSEINQIVLTIRAAKNAPIQERIQKYFSNWIFDKIKASNPEILKKVVFLKTNLEESNCGLSSADYDFVKSSVNIIFHCAASVEFAVPLAETVNCNIKITQNIINVSKAMTNLIAFVYVSTAWSHTIMDYTEEKVHNLAPTPEFLYNLIENLDEDTINKIMPIILDRWPNTYTMTKNISENLVEAEKDILPVAIFRPSIVLSTLREPYPGWINSIQGAIAIGINLAAGTIKVIPSNLQNNGHLVPGDFVINCMIAIAWHTATQTENKKLNVFNYSPVMNHMPRKKFYDSFINTKYPLEFTVWRPGYVATTSKLLYEIYALFYQSIPAYICDIFLKISQQKPIFQRLMKKNRKLLMATKYFAMGDFKIEYNNVPILWKSLNSDDQEIFYFDLDSINWDEYMDVLTKCAKVLLKDNFNDMEKCEAKRYLMRCKF